MKPTEARKQAIAAYKEKKDVGGLFRIVHENGWQGPVLATPNLAGMQNRLAFAKKTGGCFDMKLREVWDRFPAEGFSLVELERLEGREGQTAAEFRAELGELLALWRDGNGEGCAKLCRKTGRG